MKIKVYIARPYTKGDVAVNVKRQLDMADQLMSLGYVPFVPLYSHFQHMVHPADSKGDADVTVLDVRMVTAAKLHRGACFPCLGDIADGERHRVERGVMDGKARTCRTCATCCAAMAAYMLGTDHYSIEWRYALGRNRADQLRAAKRAAGVRGVSPTADPQRNNTVGNDRANPQEQ